MGKTQLSEFPWWHLTSIALPERSTLYAPAPIGVGTPLCESLTSYLARLAEPHSVYPGVLLQPMYVPLLWIYREISTCTRHGVRLQTHCHHCARSLHNLTWRSRRGYCAFCSG